MIQAAVGLSARLASGSDAPHVWAVQAVTQIKVSDPREKEKEKERERERERERDRERAAAAAAKLQLQQAGHKCAALCVLPSSGVLLQPSSDWQSLQA